jgi:hypothetical protein
MTTRPIRASGKIAPKNEKLPVPGADATMPLKSDSPDRPKYSASVLDGRFSPR